jgi:tRNA nucleotidyltransferase/poly(A) polymerase
MSIKNTSPITHYSSRFNMDIEKKILSDPVNNWVFQKAHDLQADIYLVGGYIRDILLGVTSNDKDYVINKHVKNIAQETAKTFHGSFIEFKQKNTYRVVLKQKSSTLKSKTSTQTHNILDFTRLKYPIEKDLRERDFTVDALAWSQNTGIIDPCAGSADLKRKLIKAVRMRNFLQDPVRLLRTYRIAAELGFQIDKKSRKYIKNYAKNIGKVARERITEEFIKILNEENSLEYVQQCYKDTLLEKILLKDPRKRRRLSENIKLLNAFDVFIMKNLKKISGNRKELTVKSFNQVSQGLTVIGLLRLSFLLHNLDPVNSYLCLSNVINKATKDINSVLKIIQNKKSEKNLYEIFNESGYRIFETAVLLAFVKKRSLKEMLERANTFSLIQKKRLLNGDEIKRILGIGQGKRVGEILSIIQQKQFLKLLKTKAEAKKWVISSFT